MGMESQASFGQKGAARNVLVALEQFLSIL